MEQNERKSILRTPEGTYEVTYREIEREKICDKDDFVEWFVEEAIPRLKESIKEWTLNKETVFSVKPDYVLARIISEYLTRQGYLPKKIKEETK